MSTATQTRTERQIEQSAQEIGHYVIEIRRTIADAKHLIDGQDVNVVEVDKAMDLHINECLNGVANLVAGQSKPVAQALAERYGVHFLKKHTSVEVAKNAAAQIVGAITREDENYRAVSNAATAVRVRANRIEDAGRALRYWASDAFVADDTNAWRMDGDVENVQAMLKHWGKVYCQARGLDGIVVFPQDEHLGQDTVEEALHRVGRYALHCTLSGMGRFGGESSLMQIRLGNLMGHLYEDFAHKLVVKMTLGALGRRDSATDLPIDYDDADEYVPTWRSDDKDRKAFAALEP